MKHLFLLATLFGAQLTFAQVPNVKCFAIYNKSDQQGFSYDDYTSPSKQVPAGEGVEVVRGFTITTRMNPIFPVNKNSPPPTGFSRGRPVIQSPGLPPMELPPGPAPYSLNIQIAKGDAIGEANTSVMALDPMNRLSVALSVGNEHLLLNCDQELP